MITTYSYDQLNRLLSRSTPGEDAGELHLHAHRQAADNDRRLGHNQLFLRFDGPAHLKATPEGTLNYTYDAAGNLASMTSNHAHGVSVAYAYDDLNRLSTVADARLVGSSTTTYTYDNASNVGTVTYPNGVKAQFAYDR